jgi:hypothetical protein
MSPLREPDPSLDGFQLPEPDAPRAEWERAFKRLNSVPLSLDQIERGYQASFVMDPDGVTRGPETRALRVFCEAERILPADVAAEAIMVRWSAVLDAAFDGVDVLEGPEPYVMVALRHLEVQFDVLQFVGTGAATG